MSPKLLRTQWLNDFFIHFDKKTKGEKKVFSLKCTQKSNVIKKRIWVLVIGFMYLVLVDAMD